MGALVEWIFKYGWAPVAFAVGLYLLLKGEIIFRYPRGPGRKRG